MGDNVAASKGARADPRVGQAVAVGRVHARLNLEDERAERRVDRTRRAVDVEFVRWGGGASCTRLSSSWFTPKFSAAEVNSTGVPARQEGLLIVVGAVGGEQFALFDRVVPVEPAASGPGRVRCAPRARRWRRRRCG